MRLLPLFPNEAPEASSFASCRASPGDHLQAHSDITVHHVCSAPAPLEGRREAPPTRFSSSSTQRAGLSQSPRGRLSWSPARPTTNGRIFAIGGTPTGGASSPGRQPEQAVRPPPRREREHMPARWRQVPSGYTALHVQHEFDGQLPTPQGLQAIMPIQRELFRIPAKLKPPRTVRANQSTADGHTA